MVSIAMPARPVLVSLSANNVADTAKDVNSLRISLDSGDYVVRNVSSKDVDEEWLSFFNGQHVLRGLNLSGLDFTLASLKNFLAKFDNYNNYFLGIFDKSDRKFVGFYTVDVYHFHRTASFTTGIDTRHEKGKRTLWTTVDCVMEYFFEHTTVEKFSARVLSRNYAMIFNFKNSPTFFYEGCLRDECLSPDGTRVDILVFSSFKNVPQCYRTA